MEKQIDSNGHPASPCIDGLVGQSAMQTQREAASQSRWQQAGPDLSALALLSRGIEMRVNKCETSP